MNIAAHPLMVRAWMLQADASPSDEPLMLDGFAQEILAAVRGADEPLDPSQLPIMIHRSAAATSALAARLLALGLISFTFHAPSHSFRLIPAE